MTDRPIPTGFQDLDKLLAGGLRPGELTVISGYPGMGASTLALAFARTAALTHGLRTKLAALESTTPQTTRRIIAAEGGLALSRLTAGNLTDSDRDRAAQIQTRIEAAPLTITDHTRTLDAIMLDGPPIPRMLIIDGAHLLIPAHDYGGRAQFADDFARDLKELAVHLRMTIVVTVPLEFPFGARESNYPLLRDFGKRQSFASGADTVILLHREDYFDRNSPRSGEADLIVAKARNSPLATITLAFQAHYARYADLAGA